MQIRSAGAEKFHRLDRAVKEGLIDKDLEVLGS